MPREIRGMIAAALTPMSDDGREIAPARVNPLVEELVKAGVSGFFVCGSTGEGASLSVSERRRVAEAFAAALEGPETLIVHVGHNCLKDARELAQHAASIGADAIAASPPSYFRPANAEALAECLAEIAEGAPHLPLYYYHIPEATGVAFEMREFLEKAGSRVPSLAGIKFTEERIYDFQNCMEVDGGRFNMLYGRDEMLLSALAVGAKGAVGGTYNFTARMFLRMWAAFDLGDMEEARKWQAHGARLVSVLKGYGQLCAWKTLMRWRGIELGGYRLPLKGLDASRETALKKELEEIGYFIWGD